MTSNFHTHTYRCGHATGEDREYVEEAIKGGLKVLGFSDHCPWIYKNGYVSGSRMKPEDMDDYFSSLTALKKEYERDIKIYIGFEAEYIPEQMEDQDRLFAGYPLDYLILGQHCIAPEPESEYTGVPSYNEDKLKKYIDLVIEGMDSGRYLYLAHPDLYNYVGYSDVYEREYSRLCRYLREKNMPIEINLLGARDHRHYPSPKFLEIAKEHGLKAVIGIDAHFPTALSDPEPIKKCYDLAEKFGLEVIEFSSEF